MFHDLFLVLDLSFIVILLLTVRTRFRVVVNLAIVSIMVEKQATKNSHKTIENRKINSKYHKNQLNLFFSRKLTP